jgi:hypothetical protein
LSIVDLLAIVQLTVAKLCPGGLSFSPVEAAINKQIDNYPIEN